MTGSTAIRIRSARELLPRRVGPKQVRLILILFFLGAAAAEDDLPAMARVDTDGNGYVSEQEWIAFYRRADQNGDGVLEREELHASVRGIKLNGLGPAVGELGPSIRVLSQATGARVDLFDLRRKTVLVFGAWT